MRSRSHSMARRAALLLWAVALLSTPARAEITKEAKTVVDRYLQAVGGEEAYRAVRSLRMRMTIKAFGLTGTNETWIQRPDKSASQTQLGPFNLQQGFDGATSWRVDPSGKLVIQDGKDLEDAKASQYFEQERWLDPDQGGGRVAMGGSEKDSSGTWTVLEVTPPVGRARRLWFSNETGLVGKIVAKRDQQTFVTIPSDYRKVEGTRIPFRTFTQVEGLPANDLLGTIDSVWVNETFEAGRFAPPGGAEGYTVQWLKQPGTARLPYEYLGRHVWLKASVNGGPPADFIYDTGASITVIDSAYAAKIALATEGRLQGQGAGASGGASLAKLESLRIESAEGDGIALKDTRVAVLGVNPFLAPYFWRDCAGVIGYDVISRFVNVIDFDGKTITLHDPKTFTYAGKGAAVPMHLAGTVPVVPMTIDDTYTGQFRIDVGSSSTVDVHGPFVKEHKLGKDAKATLEVLGGGFGGTFTSTLLRMKKLQIGPYAWDNPIVSLSGATTGALASEDFAGNIGNQILERFVVTLDYERRTLYLEPGKRFTDPDRFSRVGMQLARFGDTVRAAQVLPGSPAAKAGIQTGDEVRAIDGKPILEHTLEDLTQLFDRGAVGNTHMVTVVREGKAKDVRVRLRDLL